MEIIPYTPSLVVANVDQLPRGTGAKYLECIRDHKGGLIAKCWRQSKPERFQVLIKFGR